MMGRAQNSDAPAQFFISSEKCDTGCSLDGNPTQVAYFRGDNGALRTFSALILINGLPYGLVGLMRDEEGCRIDKFFFLKYVSEFTQVLYIYIYIYSFVLAS